MEIDETLVGSWVRRHVKMPWHKAQSVYIGEVLTKCGKFMSRRNAKGQLLEVKTAAEEGTVVDPDNDLCQSCFR